MIRNTHQVARVQKALQYFEGDMILLNLRIKDLSAERQQSARQFAEDLVLRTRAELQRLIAEEPMLASGREEAPCEPAD